MFTQHKRWSHRKTIINVHFLIITFRSDSHISIVTYNFFSYMENSLNLIFKYLQFKNIYISVLNETKIEILNYIGVYQVKSSKDSYIHRRDCNPLPKYNPVDYWRHINPLNQIHIHLYYLQDRIWIFGGVKRIYKTSHKVPIIDGYMIWLTYKINNFNGVFFNKQP